MSNHPPPRSAPKTPVEEFQALSALRSSASSGMLRAVEGVESATARALKRIVERLARDSRHTPLRPPPLTAPLSRGVLVVEDDEFLRETVIEELAHHYGVPVWGAANAEEARIEWGAHRPEVVVADLYLGHGEDGDQYLCTLPHGVHRVLVSGTIHDETLETAARLARALSLPKNEDMIPRLLALVGTLLSPAPTKGSR